VKSTFIKKVLMLLPVIILLIDVVPKLYENIRLQQEYIQFPPELSALSKAFIEEVPLHEMDEKLLYELFNPYFDPWPMVQNPVLFPYAVITEKEICYYKEPTEKSEVTHMIPAGSMIKWSHPEDTVDYVLAGCEGYGVISFPTYEKGWRYVKPFVMSDETEMPDEMYYVRLEDLEYVFQAVQKHPEYAVSLSGWESEEARLFGTTRYIDKVFYDHGVFISKDYYRKVWHWWDMVFLMMFFVLQGMSFRYFKR